MEVDVAVRDPDRRLMPQLMIQVFDAWDRQRGENVAPLFSDFQLDQLPFQALPWCALLEVQSDPTDFIYRFFGTARGRLQGREYTGRSVLDTTPRMFGQKGFEELAQVLNEGKPLHFETHFRSELEGRYDSLRMPLIDRNGRIVRILSYTEGGANFSLIYRAYGTEVPGYEFHREK